MLNHFQERWEVYQFIASYKHLYPIKKMCKVLKVSRSSYYRWFSCGPSNRALENSLFTDLIRSIFDSSQKTYGSPKIATELNRQGYHISKGRVAKLMRLNGLRSKIIRKYRITTNSIHRYPIYRNYLNRNFTPEDLNEA
ncbi:MULTISPECIES: IS3 family transposase [Flavobacteriaceae]|uniref:HTH-like domain-containing protein n=2 Tax=Flavobacteriaceae TaxID=49546 RepID=A0A4Y8AVY6_9FLAO|nr:MULTISPECIES: IS3 family transposase [Flavobacteriaceae]TEW75540.1 hypothetical protein E2488_08515 [Gramella jeungdoensis]GGK46062.1 hypothetical protein GCM10007963_12890 [Lutibacter litoralis]